jgi:hypothetical protein
MLASGKDSKNQLTNSKKRRNFSQEICHEAKDIRQIIETEPAADNRNEANHLFPPREARPSTTKNQPDQTASQSS